MRLLPFALLLAVACGRPAPRAGRAGRATHHVPPADSAHYDTAVFVRQAGQAVNTISAVMQLQVAARDAQVTIQDELGRRALAGAPGSERIEAIPGSRVASLSDNPDDSLHAPWRTTVSVPVLEGERYLVELYPSSPRIDSATVALSADDRRLATRRVAVDVTDGDPALFEIAVGTHGVGVGEQIARVELVPSCGTSHVLRSAGRADLYARYEVVGTGESGDVHILPRADDARFRGVTFQTRHPGDVVITYLGHELARAPRPEGCGSERGAGSRE